MGSKGTGNKKPVGYNRVSVTLTEQQWRWLEDMASMHKLSSASKAARCCINCVALGDAVEAPPASPAAAGDRSASGGAEDAAVVGEVELSTDQAAWLESERLGEGGGDDFFSKRVIATCMAMEEYSVFGIIRCKTALAQCEGAKDAVKNIGDHYGQKEEDVVVKENIDILTKD